MELERGKGLSTGMSRWGTRVFEDGKEEQVFGDLRSALDSANETRRVLLEMGHHSSTEVTDGRDREEGVIRRYQVSDEHGAPLAIIEIRSCAEEGHV
jgi:hypothetical protein